MTQVGHFLILMTYMSFCRLNHYIDYLSDSEEALIEPALWMCLVIISFRLTFHMKETHRTINPYFKVLPTKVKRRLHVIITRYMKQECHCENHIQCDIFPSPLTTEMILPSYQQPSLSLPGFSPNYMSEPSWQIYARRALGEYRCATNRVSHTIKS